MAAYQYENVRDIDGKSQGARNKGYGTRQNKTATTFHVFTRVEWIRGLALVLLLLALWHRRLILLAALLIVAILLVQALYLLPALDLRVAAITAGQTPPPSPLHTWYAAAEADKLATLLALGIAAMRHLLQHSKIAG